MPHLPSGRHYALDARPLQELLRATHRGHRLSELLRIRHPKHLFPYVDVITFGNRLDGTDPPLSPNSAPLPPGLAPRPNEYTLATLPVGRRDRNWTDWRNSDDDAWREFVASPRVCASLDTLLAEVEAQREHLRRHGSTLDQQQLAQWDANRNPMQGERGDTQAIARNLMAMVGVLYDRGHQRLTFLPHIAGAGYYRYLLTVEDPPRFPREGVDPETPKKFEFDKLSTFKQCRRHPISRRIAAPRPLVQTRRQSVRRAPPDQPGTTNDAACRACAVEAILGHALRRRAATPERGWYVDAADVDGALPKWPSI